MANPAEYDPDLTSAFAGLQPTVRDDGVIVHFGDPEAELQALRGAAVVCPLHALRRIRVAGSDRVSFLHNFCTNNIKDLPAGRACEAFFVDVKARVLAHGIIAAGSTTHEVWMLCASTDTLANHLSRYVITEDVEVAPVTQESATLALIGPAAFEQTAALLGSQLDDVQCGAFIAGDGVSAVCCEWNELPTVFLMASDGAAIWTQLVETGAVPAGHDLFEYHRISEGYPVCGVDIGPENLAPEADRIKQAICYTKGCYLGQEPIARLDAMGHVNRKLYRCTFIPADDSESPAEFIRVSSHATVGDIPRPALAIVRVKDAEKGLPLLGRLADGTVVNVSPRIRGED